MDNARRQKINNNLRPMYVKEIIIEHTDENHFITVNEILELLETGYGVASTRKTIYDDIDMLIESGFDIECVKGRQNKYHVLSREFDVVELRVLIDAVESLRSIPFSKSKSLVKKISRLAGPSADFLVQFDNSQLHSRTDNNQVYYIIDTIYNAIINRKQIAFKYYEYLTSSDASFKTEGKEYQVSPYRLLCSGDYYYLIGFCEKQANVTAFRVDRICSIPVVVNRNVWPVPDSLYIDNYVKESFRKKIGEPIEVVLEFESSVLDAVTDHFGKEINLSFVGSQECRGKVITPINNSFFAWIFGFDGKVRIKGPEEAKIQYVRMVSRELARL